MEKEKSSNISLLDLPEFSLDCILKHLSPLELCITSEVCTSLRNRCSSNHLWEEHVKRKWGRVIGDIAYKEWQWHITRAKEDNFIDQNGSLGCFSGVWPNLCLGSYLEDCRQLRGSSSNYFLKALYLSLESGIFWFPAQLYQSYRLLPLCQYALIRFDSKTDTFEARQQHGGWRFIRKNIEWDRVRAPPVETPPNVLHVSDLDNLKPGDHIEIQFRAKREVPYDWWYGIIGHRETCDKNENDCRCHQSGAKSVCFSWIVLDLFLLFVLIMAIIYWAIDMVVVEFKQMRHVVLSRKNYEETNDGMGRFFGGIRKIESEEEIDLWKKLFPPQTSVQLTQFS